MEFEVQGMYISIRHRSFFSPPIIINRDENLSRVDEMAWVIREAHET